MALTRFVFVLLAFGGLLAGAEPVSGPHWTRVGRTLYGGFAGPIGAPVLNAAFSPDGQTLYARTISGSAWASSDLGLSWEPFEPEVGAASPFEGRPFGVMTAPDSPRPPLGEPEARVAAHPFVRGRAYALGRHLYQSPDDGLTWINLSGDGTGSIIGYWQTSIAFHPIEADLIVVSNGLGLWKSADGGLSWSSLNEQLPNFPLSRFVRGQRVAEGLRIRGERLGVFELAGGVEEFWSRQPSEEAPIWLGALPEEDRLRTSRVSLMLPEGMAASFRIWIDGVPASPDLTRCASTVCENPGAHFITAVAVAGSDLGSAVYYVGTSDGLIQISDDGGRSWRESNAGSGETAVWAIYANPQDPLAAVAVLAGSEGGRVFRTTNGDRLWDDATANLPAGEVYAVAGSQGGAVYVAGEFGVLYSGDGWRGVAQDGFWRPAGGDLPAGPVRDLLLDDVAGFLYASIEGFGVFRARAPAVLDALRVLNAADLTQRAAAPGGLLTILGAELSRVSVGGLPAPVLASGGREAQIQVPFEVSGDRLELALETRQGLTWFGYPLAAVSPAIFVDRSGPLVLDAGTGHLLGSTFPARAGSQILILATGLGRVQPNWPTGLAAPLENPPTTVRPVRAYLNGIPLKVVSSSLAGGYIGTYMVQAEIPALLNFGVGELTIEVGGQNSNPVRIFTQP
ncbi:MAG: hypothetical protein WD733_07175 [Bryobacterales bacterium]